MAPIPPAPLHLLTGFLGSGKTTLLARLLRAPGDDRIAALVNEVGDLPLDRHLLERVDEEVLALASGCVCCSLRDGLHAAVARVHARRPTRIVLETTGLADPAPLLHALTTDPRLARLARPAGTCAVVDVLRAEELLATQPEARRQVELADRIVLTKTDLAPHREVEVRARLADAAPGCEVRTADAVDAAWLFGAPPLARLRERGTADAWLHHAPGGTTFRAHDFAHDGRVDPDALQLWLRLVTQLDGPRLLRIKALAEDRAGDVWVLQAAGGSVSPPRRLATRPPGHRGVLLVAIERGLDERAVARLLASLESAVAATPATS
jgi:G3E family GTPase